MKKPQAFFKSRFECFIPAFFVLMFLFSQSSIAINMPLPGGDPGDCPASTIPTTCTRCGDVNKDGSVTQADVTDLKAFLKAKTLPGDRICNSNVNRKEDGNYPVVDIGDVIKLQYYVTNSITPTDCEAAGNQDIYGPRIMGISAVGPFESCWLGHTGGTACSLGGTSGRRIAMDVQGGSVLVRITANDNCPPDPDQSALWGKVTMVKATLGGVEAIFTAENDTTFSFNASASLFGWTPVIQITKVEITDSAGITTVYNSSSLFDNGAFTFSLSLCEPPICS